MDKRQKKYWSSYYWKRIYMKYFFKYSMGFLAILIPCILTVLVSWTVTREQVLTAGRIRFQEGMQEIVSEISQMHILSNSVQSSESFAEISRMKGDIPWGEYLNLYHANKEMNQMRQFYEFSPFFFVLFENNDVFVSSYQCEENFSKYYGNMMSAYLSGELLDAQRFREIIIGKKNGLCSFGMLDNLIYYTNVQHNVENAIICVPNKTHFLRSAIDCYMAYVIPPQKLIELLLTEECRQEGFVRITDETGKVVLDYGNTAAIRESHQDILDIGSHWLLSAREENETKWLVQIGIPKAVISEQMKMLYRFIYGYVLAGIIVAGVLACYFGRKQYLELKNFYSLIPEYEVLDNEKYRGVKDEYEPLRNVFQRMAQNSERYIQEKAEQDRQNQAIRLEKLIVGGINTQEEREELEGANILSAEFYCVAIVRMSVKEEQEYSMALLGLKEYIQKKWSDGIFHIHTGIYDELFVFSLTSDNAPNVEGVRILFENVADVLSEETGITLGVGISTVGMDLSNLRRCYMQACNILDAYYQEERSAVNCYSVDTENIRESIINLDLMNQLHQHIMYLNVEEVQKSFLRVRAYYYKYPVQFETQKERYFYSIQNIIYNVMLQFPDNHPNENGMLPVYEKEDSVDRMTEKLQNATLWLIEELNARKEAAREQLKEDVISYVEQRYEDENMSVSMVCGDLNITERYLQTVIKDRTGDTFAVYLEKLRIKKAVELLLNTNYSNEQIAEAVGYPALSTFYRVFNKRMGMSPRALREK